MTDIAIKFENISKQYHLGKIGTGTISHDLNRWWVTNIRRKENPYLKIGQVNDRASMAEGEYVWALKDINFEVKQGEVLGIIGKNGAGKSTLLKILSRVTTPTTGIITAYGRIASLLEVGTGFHPEMTGRENIFMNGSIMGMSKAEIKRKFDEIVDFSGVKKYIDTPVKRYSSGMKVRLGFAIAAHLEPEILVVDEVLSVGDAEFQKKAIGKMQDVSKGEGRTVLFVSHNMLSIKSLCTRSVMIEDGNICFDGDVDESVEFYLNSNRNNAEDDLKKRIDRSGNGRLKIVEIRKINKYNKESEVFLSGESILLIIKIANPHKLKINDLRIDFALNDSNSHKISWFSTSLFQEKYTFEPDELLTISMEIPNIPLSGGLYTMNSNLIVNYQNEDWVPNALRFEIIDGDFYNFGKTVVKGQGKFLINHTFKK